MLCILTYGASALFQDLYSRTFSFLFTSESAHRHVHGKPENSCGSMKSKIWNINSDGSVSRVPSRLDFLLLDGPSIEMTSVSQSDLSQIGVILVGVGTIADGDGFWSQIFIHWC
jgi:hypothetical protein